MYRTAKMQKLASTAGGMRRILKRPAPVERYIRQAVEAGTYRQLDDRGRPIEPARRRSPRGAVIDDFPIEYQILKLNPPLPTPPRVPKKFRKRQSQALPTDGLVKKYLQRQKTPEGSLASAEDYYQRLLGVPPPPAQSSAMGQKSSLLNKAYAFAIKQYEVMRLQDLPEDESLEIVEKLLHEQDQQERRTSHDKAKQATEWRHAASTKTDDSRSLKKSDGQEEQKGGKDPWMVNTEHTSTATTSATSDDVTSTTIPSILYGNPRAIQAMTIWSKRLESVPYREWTVGATVALDHWIARSVLGLTEDTWEQLLEGETPSLAGRGRDIIAVRRALFPETNLQDASEEDSEELSVTDKGIDDLLASLATADDESTHSFWEDFREEGDELDATVNRLMDKLQTWRERNIKTPYKLWTSDKQEEFMDFVKTFVDSVTSGKERENVDLDDTRDALLASPPTSREESTSFWESVKDKTEAEVLLQSMLDQGPPEVPQNETDVERKAREKHEIFLSLPYDVQLQKLLDLGTLRPLHDEFIAESERKRFFARYGDKLLEAMELEHLVLDPDGPITGSFLGSWWAQNHGVQKTDRFRLEKMKYGTAEFGAPSSQFARQLYRAWNLHKAGRARYEEARFKRGDLGLSYAPPEETKK